MFLLLYHFLLTIIFFFFLFIVLVLTTESNEIRVFLNLFCHCPLLLSIVIALWNNLLSQHSCSGSLCLKAHLAWSKIKVQALRLNLDRQLAFSSRHWVHVVEMNHNQAFLPTGKQTLEKLKVGSSTLFWISTMSDRTTPIYYDEIQLACAKILT